MRSCDRTDVDDCTEMADRYGLLEISEPILPFELFPETVLSNNPHPFVSKGIQTYVPISGASTIQFEIHPQYDSESQILVVENVMGTGDNANTDDLDDGDAFTLVLDHKYRNYLKAWSSKGSFQSISTSGLWTFDPPDGERRWIVTSPIP